MTDRAIFDTAVLLTARTVARGLPVEVAERPLSASYREVLRVGRISGSNAEVVSGPQVPLDR